MNNSLNSKEIITVDDLEQHVVTHFYVFCRFQVFGFPEIFIDNKDNIWKFPYIDAQNRFIPAKKMMLVNNKIHIQRKNKKKAIHINNIISNSYIFERRLCFRYDMPFINYQIKNFYKPIN